VIAVLVTLGAVAAPAAATPVRPAGAKTPLGTERLSNERTLTRSAHPLYRAPLRRAPAASSRRVGRLRLQTEDGYPELYLALSSRRVAPGAVWIKVRIPARPNGQKGWVRREALGLLHVVRTALVIDTRRSRATLRRAGKRVWRAWVGHGAPGTPTPTGRF